MTGLARNARRNVGIDQIGPAEMLDQPVARREVDALLPFGGIDVRLCGAADGGCDRRHSRLLDLFSRPLSRDVRTKPIHSAELHITSAAAPPPGRGLDRRMFARRSAASGSRGRAARRCWTAAPPDRAADPGCANIPCW